MTVYFNVLVRISSHVILTFTVNEMGSPLSAHFIVHLKNVLYWPEDDRLRSKHVAVMWPDTIYIISLYWYIVVYWRYVIYYTKIVNTQRDGLYQIHNSLYFTLLSYIIYSP